MQPTAKTKDKTAHMPIAIPKQELPGLLTHGLNLLLLNLQERLDVLTSSEMLKTAKTKDKTAPLKFATRAPLTLILKRPHGLLNHGLQVHTNKLHAMITPVKKLTAQTMLLLHPKQSLINAAGLTALM